MLSPIGNWKRLRSSAADADIYRRFIPALYGSMLMFGIAGVAVVALVGLFHQAIFHAAALSLGLGAVAGVMIGALLGIVALGASMPSRWRRAKSDSKKR